MLNPCPPEIWWASIDHHKKRKALCLFANVWHWLSTVLPRRTLNLIRMELMPTFPHLLTWRNEMSTLYFRTLGGVCEFLELSEITEHTSITLKKENGLWSITFDRTKLN